jgi:predicted dinucleotide-binding enzyme
MKIGILGAGNVGATLGRGWAAQGHDIVFGVRDPDDPKYAELRTGRNMRVGIASEAGGFGEVVVIATPWPTTEEAVHSAGDLSGKIVIDCTNPLKADYSGLTIGHDTSAAEQIAGWAPGARVCKSFNHTGANNMANPQFAGGRAVMFVCGDDPDARAVTRRLAEELGFETVDAGNLVTARLLEPLAMLWINLAFAQGLGRDFAFALLKR